MVEIADAVRMEVRGLLIDPASNAPIVLLAQEEGESVLPIWIGPFEAASISLALEKQNVPRPMTHDLFLAALRIAGTEVLHVFVTDLREGTYFAEVHLRTSGTTVVLDARPSDAIALALRVPCPIYASRNVLTKAKTVAQSEDEEDAQERLRRMLDELDPDDLGKYTM